MDVEQEDFSARSVTGNAAVGVIGEDGIALPVGAQLAGGTLGVSGRERKQVWIAGPLFFLGVMSRRSQNDLP